MNFVITLYLFCIFILHIFVFILLYYYLLFYLIFSICVCLYVFTYQCMYCHFCYICFYTFCFLYSVICCDSYYFFSVSIISLHRTLFLWFILYLCISSLYNNNYVIIFYRLNSRLSNLQLNLIFS